MKSFYEIIERELSLGNNKNNYSSKQGHTLISTEFPELGTKAGPIRTAQERRYNKVAKKWANQLAKEFGQGVTADSTDIWIDEKVYPYGDPKIVKRAEELAGNKCSYGTSSDHPNQWYITCGYSQYYVKYEQ